MTTRGWPMSPPQVDHVVLEDSTLARQPIHSWTSIFGQAQDRMKYYVTARTCSNKGGPLYFFIDGFQKFLSTRTTRRSTSG